MRKNKYLGVVAEVISRVFDPVWEIPLALLLAVAVAMQEGLRWRFLGILMFVDAVLPMIFFLIMLVNKQIKDWDIQNRRERLPLYAFTMICHLGGIYLAHELGKAELAQILLVYYLVGLVFAFITAFWKISLHTGVNAVLITTLNMLMGFRYWYLYLILVAVSWARIYQKHHTLGQVVAGIVVGSGIVGVGIALI